MKRKLNIFIMLFIMLNQIFSMSTIHAEVDTLGAKPSLFFFATKSQTGSFIALLLLVPATTRYNKLLNR